MMGIKHFYPRSPCGERHSFSHAIIILVLFLSTLSLRRATVFLLRKITITVDISIHALLAESDFKHLENRAQDLAFLSTLSLRRATAVGVISVILII